MLSWLWQVPGKVPAYPSVRCLGSLIVSLRDRDQPSPASGLESQESLHPSTEQLTEPLPGVMRLQEVSGNVENLWVLRAV